MIISFIVLILIIIVILILIYIEIRNVRGVLEFYLEGIRQNSATTASAIKDINDDRAREWLKKRGQEIAESNESE